MKLRFLNRRKWVLAAVLAIPLTAMSASNPINMEDPNLSLFRQDKAETTATHCANCTVDGSLEESENAPSIKELLIEHFDTLFSGSSSGEKKSPSPN